MFLICNSITKIKFMVPLWLFHQSALILTFHTCIWSLSLVWFSILYLVSKFESTNQIWKCFYSKPLGKGIQEKLYFINIVSFKSKILAFWVIWKYWSNSWLGNCQIVSEEHLQQVPHINYVLQLCFRRLKILVNWKLLDFQ